MPTKTLTKTCSSCGMQKPLSAFLQLAGQLGATYGNVCSSCRKTNLDKQKPKEAEESTRSDSGFKIDAKAKVQGEIDKKQVRQQIDELYEEEEKKEEKTQSDRIIKVEKIATDEKKHRESYLKTGSFLDSNKRPTQPQEAAGAEAVARDQKVDLSTPFVDTYVAGKTKYGPGTIFQRFKYLIGASAPIVGAVEKVAKQPGAAGAGQPKKGAGETKAGAGQPEPKTLTEIAEKNWGPSKPRMK